MLNKIIEKARQLLDPVGAVEERREVFRLQCKVPVQVVGAESGEAHTAVVANISLKGLRLETPQKFKKGDRFLISVPNSRQGPVTCLIMWCRASQSSGSFSLGVRFDDTPENLGRSWLKDTLRGLGLEPGKVRERRNFIRFPSLSQVRAAMANPQGDLLGDGRLLNIGVGGALAALSVEIPVGTPVRLQLDPTLDTPPLDSQGIVRSTLRDIKRQVYVTGIEFTMPGESQIKSYIRSVKKRLAKI